MQNTVPCKRRESRSLFGTHCDFLATPTQQMEPLVWVRDFPPPPLPWASPPLTHLRGARCSSGSWSTRLTFSFAASFSRGSNSGDRGKRACYHLVSVSFSLQAVTIIFLDIEVYSLLLHPGWPLWIFVLTHSSNVHLDFEMSIAFFILLFLSLCALLFIV